MVDFGFNPALGGSIAATYSGGARTISGIIMEGGGSVTFSGGPIAGATYNHDTAASPLMLVGPWIATTSHSDTVSINIAADGSFATTATNFGCNFSGTITARPSGKTCSTCR